MKKIKKQNQKYVMQLGKGISLLFDAQLNNEELCISIGALTQILATAEKEHGVNGKDKLKNMLNSFVDKIYDEVNKEEKYIVY